jgi:acyl-CoA thioester hydrolase
MTADKPCDGVLFRQVIHVPQSAIDQNGHVNNVEYVRWMQEVAIRHSEATGGSAAMRSVGCTWVVRAHRVEYLSPAFAGDCLEAITWVATVERVRSLRRYRFIRKSDGKLLAQGETDWVFVNTPNRETLRDSRNSQGRVLSRLGNKRSREALVFQAAAIPARRRNTRDPGRGSLAFGRPPTFSDPAPTQNPCFQGYSTREDPSGLKPKNPSA